MEVSYHLFLGIFRYNYCSSKVSVVCICMKGFVIDLHFILILQIRFASVDLKLHTDYIPGGSETIFDVDRRVSERTQVIPPLPEDRFLCGFSHIFGGLLLLSSFNFPAMF